MNGLDHIEMQRIIREATDADFEDSHTAERMKNAGFDFPLSSEKLMKLQFDAPELFKEFEETYKAFYEHHRQNAERFVILTEWIPATSSSFYERLTNNVN